MRIAIRMMSFGIAGDSSYALLQEAEKKGHKWIKTSDDKQLVQYNPHAIIAGTEEYSCELLKSLPALKIIARAGVGYDAIDIKECEERGIIVTVTPDACSDAVADLVMCHIFSLLRHIYRMSAEVKAETRGFPAGLGRPHAIAGDADDAMLLAEQVERLDGLLGQADDALGWKHSCPLVVSEGKPFYSGKAADGPRRRCAVIVPLYRKIS